MQILRVFSTSLFVILLVACTSTPTKRVTRPSVSPVQALPSGVTAQEIQQGDALLADGRYVEAANIYLQLSQKAQGAQRGQLMLRAAQSYYLADDFGAAIDLIAKIPPSVLTAREQLELSLLSAECFMAEGRAAEALAALNFSFTNLEKDQTARALSARGRARFAAGMVIDGLNDLVTRGQLLWDITEQDNNQRMIWGQLMGARLDGLPFIASAQLQAWIDLARIGETEWYEPEHFLSRLEEWRVQNSMHEANRFLLSWLTVSHRRRTSYPLNVAVLLPENGRYANVSKAVKRGISSAWFSVAESRRPIIKFYDSSDGKASQAYQTAITAGADFILGPLTKDAAIEVIDAYQGGTKVLLLNDPGVELPEGMTVFALSPEREAEGVAVQALSEGKLHAMVLVPDTDWGMRVGDAFSQAYSSIGGYVVTRVQYERNAADHSKVLKQALLLNSPAARAQTHNQGFAGGTYFGKRIRGDIDFIFLAATPKQARQIKPQLKFFRAGKVPVYSTSHVYSGENDPKVDLDQNGIQFLDMPWLLETSGRWAALRAELEGLWPKRFGSRARLYAFGHDAFRVLPMLMNVTSQDGVVFSGATGNLTLEAQFLERQLVWAKFRRGIPEIIGGQPAGLSSTSEPEVLVP